MSDIEAKKQRLIEIIKKDGIIRGEEQTIVSADGIPLGSSSWLLDFRNVFLNPEALELIVEIFWERFEKEYPFQIGGQELAAVPLVSAIVLHSQKMGKPVSGFILRKSRKPYGLQKNVEGKIGEEKIILVDDLMHSGVTISRQIEVIESLGKKIDTVFILANYRENENKALLQKKNIALFFLFNVADLDLKIVLKNNVAPRQGFDVSWHFKSASPNYFHRVHKSTPVLDEDKLYFGADNACFWALGQKDGSVAWKFNDLGYPTRDGKILFSSPAIFKDYVYFGSYDGNVYALNKETGKLSWKYMDADYVSSSPAVAHDLGIVFIGLEFELFQKRGEIVALDAMSGKKIWDYKVTDFVSCSPVYCPEKKAVAIGGNDNYAYLFDASSGKLKWKYQTGGPIKSSLAFDVERNLLLFGSFDKNLYALDLDSGKVRGKFSTREAVFSTPLVHGNSVYFGSMDKRLYSLNLDTWKLNWKFDSRGRIFARPKIIGEKIYIGSTAGIFYEIDMVTGRAVSFFAATERITNEAVYNVKTENFFLLTYANEIYCLKRKDLSPN